MNTRDSKIYSTDSRGMVGMVVFSRASRRLVTRVQPHTLLSRRAGRGLSRAEHSRSGRGGGGACNGSRCGNDARNERDRESKKKKKNRHSTEGENSRRAATFRDAAVRISRWCPRKWWLPLEKLNFPLSVPLFAAGISFE